MAAVNEISAVDFLNQFNAICIVNPADSNCTGCPIEDVCKHGSQYTAEEKVSVVNYVHKQLHRKAGAKNYANGN